MPKSILQDVLAKERRNIRQVPLPSSRKDSVPDAGDLIYEREDISNEEGRGAGWSRFLLWGAAAFFLFLLGAIAALGFRGAVITVTPKSASVTLAHSFAAARNATGDALRFEPVPLSKTVETTVPADAEKQVSEKASGRIAIYNNFSERPQRLIKNTRFETSDGLIYRIDKSITVPGRSRTGGATMPGTVEVTVYADSPGEEYNIPLSDFTVPGFKNDPARFAGFYARSKTPMTGGREGMVKTPSEAAEKEARTALRAELEKGIRGAVAGQTPGDFILFDDAVSIVHESLPVTLKERDTAVIAEKAAAVAYLFRRSELASAIAKTGIRAYNGLPVEIANWNDLAFSLEEPPAVRSEVRETLRFTLKGKSRVVWRFDEEALRTALAGKQKDELGTALSAFPTIERIDVILRPFWSRHFPDNPKKIRIEAAPADGVDEGT